MLGSVAALGAREQRVGAQRALREALEQCCGDARGFLEALLSQARHRSREQRAVVADTLPDALRLGAAAERGEQVGALQHQALLGLGCGLQLERALDARERCLLVPGGLFGARAPAERLGVGRALGRGEGLQRRTRVARAQQRDAALQRALAAQRALREALEHGAEVLGGPGLIAELDAREARAAQRRVGVGTLAHRGVGLQRAARVVRVEQALAEQERQLAFPSRRCAGQRRARGLRRFRTAPEALHAPRAAAARIRGVVADVLARQELLEVRQRVLVVLARELGLRQQRERGRSQVLLLRAEHLRQRLLGRLALAGGEQALAQAELHLGRELELGLLRELAEYGRSVLLALQLEQRAAQAVAHRVGLGMVGVLVEETLRLAHHALAQTFLRQRRDVGVLLLGLVLHGRRAEREREHECAHGVILPPANYYRGSMSSRTPRR